MIHDFIIYISLLRSLYDFLTFLSSRMFWATAYFLHMELVRESLVTQTLVLFIIGVAVRQRVRRASGFRSSPLHSQFSACSERKPRRWSMRLNCG